MDRIKGSVGVGGKNLPEDVRTIQRLLNANLYHLIPLRPLQVDGKIGEHTLAAIREFQIRVVRMTRPDVVVDPGGNTFRKLTGAPGSGATAARSSKWSGDSARWSEDKKLASCDPRFRAKVVKLLAALRKRKLSPKLFYAWRSVQVQAELVRKGRSKVRFSFHNAQKKDGTPNAYAADICHSKLGWQKVPEVNAFWQALGEEAKKVGLYWGGDWKSFKDWAHVQYHPNSRLGSVKRESGL